MTKSEMAITLCFHPLHSQLKSKNTGGKHEGSHTSLMQIDTFRTGLEVHDTRIVCAAVDEKAHLEMKWSQTVKN